MKLFDARVLGYSRSLTPDNAREVGAEYAPLDSLLKESDIVTLHVQLYTDTRGLIGEREIALMKPGALLVNTSRGPLINEQALIAALERGHLGGVGLDVFDIEPLPSDHALRKFDNAILLSHRGYATLEVLQERYQEALNNILDYLDGKPLNLLNPDVLKP
jgi:phosphoglycerate dehydrogenase-like enzyme